MPRKRGSSSVKAGQATIFGDIEGLDQLVNKPEVIEYDGLRVVALTIREEDINVPGYVDTALKIARQFAPEVRSNQRPPWLQQGWQVRRRKKKAGVE